MLINLAYVKIAKGYIIGCNLCSRLVVLVDHSTGSYLISVLVLNFNVYAQQEFERAIVVRAWCFVSQFVIAVTLIWSAAASQQS